MSRSVEPVRTNAVRLLESLGIPFELRGYTVDPEDLSAETVAAKIGLPVEQVFKTLVVRGERAGPAFAVIAGDAELDPKRLAQAMEDKRAALVPLKEVEALTGYVRGGCTVFCAKQAFPVYVDEWIELHDRIAVSAGVRGTQILLHPRDYIRAADAKIAALTR